jgi:hypothetical protein
MNMPITTPAWHAGKRLAAGGRWLEPGRTRELEGFRWRLMADPDGNEFDIDVLPPG